MRDTQGASDASGADHDRELAETFEFVDEAGKGKEAEPVFEEVAEEDRTEALAREVLDAQAGVNQAIRDAQARRGKPFARELALRSLAQVKVRQARHNLGLERGTEAMLDKAMAELRRTEDTLRQSEQGAEALARHRARVETQGGVDIGGESALQIEGRRRREESEVAQTQP